MDGILPLWKEKGMTSHDCVFKLRKILQTKKIGHTGTLDPEVDGVLPICIGTATKAVEFMTDLGKAYTGEITLGFSTTTEDAHGEVIAQKPVDRKWTLAEIDEQMASFLGEITQIPPMYSAVKVNGRKLYEYARSGEEVVRPVRKATIYDFQRISEPHYDDSTQTVSWKFNVRCGKGTYIRTLAVDLGEKLGFPAHMSQLTRTHSGPFATKDCFTLDQVREIKENNRMDEILQPIDMIFEKYPAFHLTEPLWDRIKNGAVIESEAFMDDKDTPLLALYYSGQLVALYKEHPTKPGFKKPRKMFLP